MMSLSIRNPMAYITAVKTVLGTKPSPHMAAFSSRGPNSIQAEILKVNTMDGLNIVTAL